MDYIAENKKVYNTIASHFSQTRAWLWDDLKDLKRFVAPGMAILDIGCGNGRLYQMFADLSIYPENSLESRRVCYTGIDQSEELIVRAKEKFSEAEFVVGNMIALPFQESSFDVIYCIAAFHHLPKDELRLQALQEMRRVLKPAGKVIMTNWNAESNWAKKKIQTGEWIMPAPPAGGLVAPGGERHGEDVDHFIVPWKNNKQEVKGLRHYWLLTPEHLERLAGMAGFIVEDQYFVSRGERVAVHRGMNLVSIFNLPE